jgi:hypothetical protein
MSKKVLLPFAHHNTARINDISIMLLMNGVLVGDFLPLFNSKYIEMDGVVVGDCPSAYHVGNGTAI